LEKATNKTGNSFSYKINFS